jgi:hypothetical protein
MLIRVEISEGQTKHFEEKAANGSQIWGFEDGDPLSIFLLFPKVQRTE